MKFLHISIVVDVINVLTKKQSYLLQKPADIVAATFGPQLLSSWGLEQRRHQVRRLARLVLALVFIPIMQHSKTEDRELEQLIKRNYNESRYSCMSKRTDTRLERSTDKLKKQINKNIRIEFAS